MSAASETQLDSLFIKLASKLESILRRRGTWVLLDQAIVSAGNFLTGNLLGRTLRETEYGAYGLLLETMLYLNSLQAALVIYPLTIQGATSKEKSLGRLATASCVFTLCLLPLLGMATAISLRAMETSGLTIAAICAMVLWQLQETLRRGLLSELRVAETVLSDAVRYIGQALCIAILVWFKMLTLRSALVVMALTSAASMAVQAWQIGMQPIARHELGSLVRDFWRLGRWMVLSNAGSLVTTLGYWWTLKWQHGLTACGVFNAIVQVFKLANPIMNGMTALIVPAVARAAVDEGFSSAKSAAMRYIGLGAALLSPYFLVLAVLPTWSLATFYSSDSPYVQHGTWLQLFVMNFTCVYFSAVMSSWLMGLGKSQWNFYVQVICVVVTLVIGLPMTYAWGVAGVTIGGLISALSAAVCSGWFIHKAHVQAKADTPPHTDSTNLQTAAAPPPG